MRYKGNSLLNHGDLSILSFHATKVFNTFEGGAIVCRDAQQKRHIDNLKNFGFVDEVTVMETGINGKMSEFNAAFGLLQLKHIDKALERRKTIAAQYRAALSAVSGITLLPEHEHTLTNTSYFPILINKEYPSARDDLYEEMKQQGIYARRYFYPLISDMPMYRGLPGTGKDVLTTARRIAAEVICLPLYPSMSDQEVGAVIQSVITP